MQKRPVVAAGAGARKVLGDGLPEAGALLAGPPEGGAPLAGPRPSRPAGVDLGLFDDLRWLCFA